METETSSITQPVISSNKNEINKSNPSGLIKMEEKEDEKYSTVNITAFPKEIEPKKNTPKDKISNIKSEESNFSIPNNDEIKVVSEFFSENITQNPDIIIEIDEDSEIPQIKNKSAHKINFKKNTKKNTKGKSQFVFGYNPFIFYEKEKFKEKNFKGVTPREYVKIISAEWKKMSEKEKEPYIKLALEFKHNLSQNHELKELTNKKRKRNIEEEVIDLTGKKKKNVLKSERKKCLSTFSENHKSVNVTVGKKRKKNDLKKDNMFVVTNNYFEDVKEYFSSILVPFVEKSYEFFRRHGINISKC